MHYRTLGQFNQYKKEMDQKFADLQKSIQNPEKKVDSSKFDDDTQAFIQQEAARIAQEKIDALGLKPAAAGEDKELDLFLDKKPEAYVHLETIQNLRKQYPTMSYSKIFRTFIEDDDAENIPKRPLGSGNDGPSN